MPSTHVETITQGRPHSEHRLAFHRIGHGHTKITQNGWRKVDNAGLRILRLAIHEENTGHRFGINDVIAAPAALIVLQQRIGKVAKRRVPLHPVSGSEVDEEVGRVFYESAEVESLPSRISMAS